MMDRENEIERFKTDINLSAYAATQGYSLDRRGSSRNTALMANIATGDKIIIKKGRGNHWVYCSVRDRHDNGTIIDFIQNRRRVNLGAVRQELRPYLTGAAWMPSDAALYAAEVEATHSDPDAVQAALGRAERLPFGQHPYLNGVRGLSAALLALPQFAAHILTDERGNVLFPHAGADGYCGAEVKNQGFTGFLPHGTKGLWYSGHTPDDAAMVVCETAIDCLSYAALHGIGSTRFFSTAGTLNPDQPDLLRRAIEKFRGRTVIIATDNDDGGDLLAECITAAYDAAQKRDCHLHQHRPENRGDDWNNVLLDSKPLFPDLSP